MNPRRLKQRAREIQQASGVRYMVALRRAQEEAGRGEVDEVQRILAELDRPLSEEEEQNLDR